MHTLVIGRSCMQLSHYFSQHSTCCPGSRLELQSLLTVVGACTRLALLPARSAVQKMHLVCLVLVQAMCHARACRLYELEASTDRVARNRMWKVMMQQTKLDIAALEHAFSTPES